MNGVRYIVNAVVECRRCHDQFLIGRYHFDSLKELKNEARDGNHIPQKAAIRLAARKNGWRFTREGAEAICHRCQIEIQQAVNDLKRRKAPQSEIKIS